MTTSYMTAREIIAAANEADIRRLRALNAALQQSLDEANARIDELTAKTALPFEVGDKVRSTNNMSPHVVYTVVRINKDLRLLDVKGTSGRTYHGYPIDLFYKVS